MIRTILVAAVAVSALAVVACKPAAQAPAESAPVEAPAEPTQPVSGRPTDQTGARTGEEAADAPVTVGDATASTDTPAAGKNWAGRASVLTRPGRSSERPDAFATRLSAGSGA